MDGISRIIHLQRYFTWFLDLPGVHIYIYIYTYICIYIYIYIFKEMVSLFGNLYLIYPETIISSSREAFYPAAITSFHQKSPPQIEDSTNLASQISLTMPSGKWASHSVAAAKDKPRNQWGIQLANLSNGSIRGDKPDKPHKAFQEKNTPLKINIEHNHGGL